VVNSEIFNNEMAAHRAKTKISGAEGLRIMVRKYFLTIAPKFYKLTTSDEFDLIDVIGFE